jgi:hypothetical protein
VSASCFRRLSVVASQRTHISVIMKYKDIIVAVLQALWGSLLGHCKLLGMILVSGNLPSHECKRSTARNKPRGGRSVPTALIEGRYLSAPPRGISLGYEEVLTAGCS